MLNLMFRICKSQHTADVKVHHERHARKKDTKSAKETHSHLNLQLPHSPITSEVEEIPENESFEKRIACFDVETPVQQWYWDASFSGLGFDYGGMARASSSHPPPFDSPPPAQTHEDEGEDESEDEDDDELNF
jgi:hypothetical protein